MKVLGHEPHAWYLLEEGDVLYLDVFCSNSFFSYGVLIALNNEELGRYASEGRNYSIDWRTKFTLVSQGP